jgi:hypothetical protein
MKTLEKQKELRYEGYFLMNSGLKVYFDISADNGGENYDKLCDAAEFNWKQGESIYLENDGEYSFVLADKVIGFSIRDYNQEI